MSVAAGVADERVEISTYTIPTDEPESDGTLEWDETTIVVVELAGGHEWSFAQVLENRPG
jgi:hypothetical protein